MITFGVVLFFGGGLVSAIQGRVWQRPCVETAPAVEAHEPERAAALADLLVTDPAEAECNLARHGMNSDEFVALMARIAEDERLTRVYLERRTVRPGGR